MSAITEVAWMSVVIALHTKEFFPSLHQPQEIMHLFHYSFSSVAGLNLILKSVLTPRYFTPIFTATLFMMITQPEGR